MDDSMEILLNETVKPQSTLDLASKDQILANPFKISLLQSYHQFFSQPCTQESIEKLVTLFPHLPKDGKERNFNSFFFGYNYDRTGSQKPGLGQFIYTISKLCAQFPQSHPEGTAVCSRCHQVQKIVQVPKPKPSAQASKSGSKKISAKRSGTKRKADDISPDVDAETSEETPKDAKKSKRK